MSSPWAPVKIWVELSTPNLFFQDLSSETSNYEKKTWKKNSKRQKVKSAKKSKKAEVDLYRIYSYMHQTLEIINISLFLTKTMNSEIIFQNNHFPVNSQLTRVKCAKSNILTKWINRMRVVRSYMDMYTPKLNVKSVVGTQIIQSVQMYFILNSWVGIRFDV